MGEEWQVQILRRSSLPRCQYRGGVYCTVANTGECSYAPLATAYKFVNSFVVIAYFLLRDENNQAVIATLHEIDERDHREEDATIKQTRFPQNSERKKKK